MFQLKGSVFIGLFVLLLMAVAAVPASAAVGLTLNPSASNVGIGSYFDVDVYVLGLDTTDLAAYTLDIGFNDDVLEFQDIAFGPYLGFDTDSLADFLVGAGSVNVAETSFLFDFADQPDAFSLFTMTFQAEALGSSDFSFLSVDLSDSSAQAIEASLGSNVNVVPIPGALWLLGSGLLALTSVRRKSRS